METTEWWLQAEAAELESRVERLRTAETAVVDDRGLSELRSRVEAGKARLQEARAELVSERVV
jgi:predicted  nucleic acid-binding Zn-ribbon protein